MMFSRCTVIAALAVTAFLPAAPFFIDRSYELQPSREYCELAKQYSRVHYGIDSAALTVPRIIAIHMTECGTMDQTLAQFNHPRLTGRREIEHGGQWNVGSHFIVDANGTIFSFIPLEYMARHIIGLNHTAVGIENIAANNEALTEAQLFANVQLVLYLKSVRPSITHVIGHHEYTDTFRTHYRLMRMLDEQYRPHYRGDPGERFMRLLREGLSLHGLDLFD
ncbi:MAG: peptidoglycan recognition family protein [Spirochaetota bacterium]